jgi:ribosomal protein L32
MKKYANLTLLFVLSMSLLAFNAAVVHAQTPVPEYTIRFNRDFGYGAGSNVRGTFSLAISGDLEKVSSVTYLIDGKELATVTETPFKYQFHTDSQGYGWHDLGAEITLTGGNQVSLSSIRYNFVSAEDEKTDMTGILLPIGGIVVGALLVSVLIQFLGRKKRPIDPDVPRDYGMLGGTICPKCGHPFPRSLIGMNLVVGRLERCESCGKFSLTRRATTEELYRAEVTEKAAAREATQAAKVEPKKDDTADKLDDSKYIDSI